MVKKDPREINVQIREWNGDLHASCPYCEKKYLLPTAANKAGPVPAYCARCECPMDRDDAIAFSDRKAKEGMNPAIREMAIMATGKAAGNRVETAAV